MPQDLPEKEPPQKELSEKDMISDSLAKNPFPAWIWFALIVALAALIWGGSSWFLEKKSILLSDSPFLRVTNRDFSLFLWQNPEYMRANVSSKAGYLPDFQYIDKVSIEPGRAEKYVSAPPEVLFLYHVWSRLIKDEFAPRPILSGEFQDFLSYCKEWRPENWPAAPDSYKELLRDLPSEGDVLILRDIPKEVQQAFIGWKNYTMEGTQINAVKPTFGEMAEFLTIYPHYARNYWRNIVEKGRPDYLKTIALGKFEQRETIPADELAGFLKVAFFNYQQAKKKL